MNSNLNIFVENQQFYSQLFFWGTTSMYRR